jgi:DNA repair exonuclease SbcCD ATPase subunit
MAAIRFDTLKLARKLEAAGFAPKQAGDTAEALSESLGEISDLATKADLHELRAELKADMGELRAELRAEIGELRSELRAEMAELRSELRADMGELRVELKAEMSDLRGDNALLRAEMKQLGVETKADLAEIKSDLVKWVFASALAQTAGIVALLKLLP